MPWLKAGDDAATHPIVMRTFERGDLNLGTLSAWDRANLVFGLVLRCALDSAGHLTDYFISAGTVLTMGGPNGPKLAEEARKDGYWRKHRRDGEQGYLLVEDPNFIHIRLKAEIEWERQQARDASNPALTVPVRLRDGDACRYCTRIVQWNARRGARRGTYDHREPGQAATVDTLVVACGGCNSGRRDRDDADEQRPLLDPPQQPYYSDYTAAWLARHGHHVTPTSSRPDTDSDTATARPSPPGHRADPRPGTQPDTAPRDPADGRTPRSADQLPTEPGFPGSGRATGSGRAPGQGSGGRRTRARRGRPRTGGDR